MNNAGIQHTASVKGFPQDHWDGIIGINFTATFMASKTVLPGMLERNWGRIINDASTHAWPAAP